MRTDVTYQTYPRGSAFSGVSGRTVAGSQPAWPRAAQAPDGAPNIITIVLDDLGFAQVGCFGGLGGRIRTPHLDRLAAGGLRLRNFHVTPLCSPTRAALLTGRNAHSVGVGSIMEYATGYPGYNTEIPDDAAMTPAILREHGYSTMALGKWHLTPDRESGPWGPFDRWPVAKGFDRFYGFLPGETSQWAPELWLDNQRVEAPAPADEGYHLSEDLVDKAQSWIGQQSAVTPSKPFYLYLAFGAMHAPHHAPQEWIDRYAGAFEDGWDVIRAETLQRQIELGVVPEGTQLPEHNDGIKSWSDLTEQEQRVFCRQMETFAGFLSHTDHQIGRLVEYLRATGELDNTLIFFTSDNGASAEGGPIGLFHELSYFNRQPEDLSVMEARLDEWGGPSSHPHYATGWAEAGNTPNRWFKTTCHEGGTRSPCIVHWPRGIKARGEVRSQYAHAIDLAPTLLEAAGVDQPDRVGGVAQRPIEGASFHTLLEDAAAASSRSVQHFECFGHRAIWRDGWKAVALHVSSTHAFRVGMDPSLAHDGDYDSDQWELFDLDRDFSETTDLADQHPERLQELVDLWWKEAEQHSVLPLDDRGTVRTLDSRPTAVEKRREYAYAAPIMLGSSSSPDLRNRSFQVRADIDWGPGQEGAIVSFGNNSGGFSVFVLDDTLHFSFAYLAREEFRGSSDATLAPGRHQIELTFTSTGPGTGSATLAVDGRQAAVVEEILTNPVLWSIGQGLQVGGDSITAVSGAYRAPFDFQGELHHVRISIPDDTQEDQLDSRALAQMQQ